MINNTQNTNRERVILPLVKLFTIAISLFAITPTVFADSRNDHPLSILLVQDAIEFSLGEPILLSLEINNKGSKDAEIELGPGSILDLAVLATLPGDSKSQQFTLTRKEGTSRISTIRLKPGEVYRDQLILNQWVDFNSLGVYKIDFKLTGPFFYQLPEQADLHWEFKTFQFTVGDANNAQMAKKANKFAQMALNDERYAITDPANVVSFFQNSAALPAFKSILDSPDLIRHQFVIHGLFRMANKPALELILTYKNRMNELGDNVHNSLIKFHLHQLAKNKQASVEIRQMAKSALEQ